MLMVNLGGTCGNSNWRETLIKLLNSNIKYFNPVVENWKYTESIKLEKQKRMQDSDILLYVITPEQKGFSAIASAVDYSNKVPSKLVFCVLYEYNDKQMEGHMLESIKSVEDIIKDNGCMTFNNLTDVANYLNNIAINYENL